MTTKHFLLTILATFATFATSASANDDLVGAWNVTFMPGAVNTCTDFGHADNSGKPKTFPKFEEFTAQLTFNKAGTALQGELSTMKTAKFLAAAGSAGPVLLMARSLPNLDAVLELKKDKAGFVGTYYVVAPYNFGMDAFGRQSSIGSCLRIYTVTLKK